MIPLAVPNLDGNERAYLNRCIDTTFVSSVGEYVNKLEAMTAAACGTRYAVATSAGTTGLHAALLACGVGHSDLVVIPSFTFIATANAVAHCRAAPWLMDIERSSWTLDPAKLEAELARYTEFRDGRLLHKPTGRRVAAIMPVHTLGNVADMPAIQTIAQRYGLPVAADAACAVGALSVEITGRAVGRSFGTVHWSGTGAFPWSKFSAVF